MHSPLWILPWEIDGLKQRKFYAEGIERCPQNIAFLRCALLWNGDKYEEDDKHKETYSSRMAFFASGCAFNLLYELPPHFSGFFDIPENRDRQSDDLYGDFKLCQIVGG